jgi:hypothetical protein
MAYQDPEMSGTEDESAADDKSQDGGDTFFLPAGLAQGQSYSPGDTITLTVVGKDKNGDVEVKLAESEGETTEEPLSKDDMKQQLLGGQRG